MLRQQGSKPALGDLRESVVVAHPSAPRTPHPMIDATIDEIDGRLIRIGSHWLIDFTSGNYLGFDFDPEIIDAVPRYLTRWGTQPGWSRLRGSPVLYDEIESTLAALLGVGDTLVLPTVGHIHNSVLPTLACRGTIFVDSCTRRTLRDACTIAGVDGATLRAFEDVAALEALLRSPHAAPRVICVDGVNNLSGNPSDLPTLARLAREFDALLYVDDSHGFGVLGERSADELCDYGRHGNGLVRHFGEAYENIVLVGSFAKAYSSALAYIGCSTTFKQVLKNTQPYLVSGQSPVAALATVIEGFRVNEQRGDQLRLAIHRMTARVLASLHDLGIATSNVSGYPMIEIPLANPDDIDAVGAYLYHHGIYVTMAVPPLVPEGQASFRLQITAVNTWEQIEQLVRTLGELSDRFRLQSAVAA
jgi:8-amino-7-oxononanoate synthase